MFMFYEYGKCFLQNVAGSVFYNCTVLRWTRLSISPIAVVLYHVEQGYQAA